MIVVTQLPKQTDGFIPRQVHTALSAHAARQTDRQDRKEDNITFMFSWRCHERSTTNGANQHDT